jgi:hypothetical protein
MNSREFNWSPSEKKIARSAFDLALKIEMTNLKVELGKKVSKDMSNKEVWELEDFLSEKREEIDYKYDYRYSQLIRVFGILVGDGILSLKDLDGLSDEKIEAIKIFSGVE